MERETVIHQIGGKAVVVKSYATAREVTAIQKAYFGGAKITVTGGQPSFSEVDPNVTFDVHKVMIDQLVVSIGEVTTALSDCALDNMQNDDFQDLIRILDDIASKKKS